MREILFYQVSVVQEWQGKEWGLSFATTSEQLEHLAYMAEEADYKLLKACGVVLPEREWESWPITQWHLDQASYEKK